MSDAVVEQRAALTSSDKENKQVTGDVEDKDVSNDEEEVIRSENETNSDGSVAENGQAKMNEDSDASQVYTATTNTLWMKEKNTDTLTLEWAFGMNAALPVFSLQDNDQLVVLYATTNIGVIYNHTSNSQHLLQGHCGPISCLCVSDDRRWLVTADTGPDSVVIIWDLYSGIPVHSLFDCHSEGVVIALALSKNAKYLATLGHGEVQCLCIWDWTNETDKPLCLTKLSPEYVCQNYIIFNPNDSTELLSNSESQVLFYKMTQTNLEYTAPKLQSKVVGSLSQSVFHWKDFQALTATLAGNLVMWDMDRANSTSEVLVRKTVMVISLQSEPITVLSLTDSYIVTGDTLGHIKFYDENVQLISWYSEFNLEAITSICFSKECADKGGQGYKEGCDLGAKPLIVRNFVVSTVSSTIVHVKTQGGVAQKILHEHCEPLHAVACHPRKPLVAMGSYSGILKVCDYNIKLMVSSRVFKTEMQIQCLAFDPQGSYLAVGFANGAVYVLDSGTLHSDPEECFDCSQDSISHITFSLDSQYLATADAGRAVTVFHLQDNNGSQRWNLVGRYHSHYKPIIDLLFGVDLDSTQPRLLSLGMDRRLVEYDLVKSKDNQLLILSTQHVEQSAVPTCMTWYPPLTTEQFLLTASDRCKMKLFNSTTMMCRKTLLGPVSSQVEKMAVLPRIKDDDTSSYYLAYITKYMVGLQILPLDGNPYKTNDLVCHPTGVSAMACSYDGQFVFTAGGPDCTLLSWEISLNAMEAAAALGGKDLMPFYTLLDGGRSGAFYSEMEDFFYYCQLHHQGLDSMEKRQICDRMPLAEVPFMMRALGFFPTEQELEDMHNEVKFSKYAETGKYVTDIDMEELIKLYINHRPAFAVDELPKCFQVLGDMNEMGEPVLERKELLQLVQARGERMTEDEMAECFGTLLVFNQEGETSGHEASECKEYSPEYADIPEEISAENFKTFILGFPSYTADGERSSTPE